jgi:glycyl-tRNA synthetase beta chain
MKPATADLLFELGTEELPAGPLLSMGEALRTSILEGLADHGLLCATNQIFVTPRRLAVLVRAVSLEAPDKTVEALGPPVAAARDKAGDWTPAALGFAKKRNLKSSIPAKEIVWGYDESKPVLKLPQFSLRSWQMLLLPFP